MRAGAVDPEVMALVTAKGIGEVLHFTTDRGLLGIFATKTLLSRARLEKEKHIEHIFAPNCENRLKDPEWTDYVSMSISRVNGRMLGVSEKWHESDGRWWAVLSFDVTLLGDPGVFFATTNNTYRDCVQRGQGADALKKLFAPAVEWGWHGSKHVRTATTPPAWTTDPQAEVLYPREVPIGYLRAIYVREHERLDDVRGLFGVFRGIEQVPVECRPEVFQ